MDSFYSAQRKTFFGWKDLKYSRTGPEILSFDKQQLIDEILDIKYQKCRKYVTIHEYPTIKIH